MSQFYTERRFTSILKQKLDTIERLPLLKQKALAKDMSLPFAESLEGLNVRAHA
jgi:hypothetical protein